MSRIQDVIKEYRQRLLAHERTAMASLDYAHRQTLAMIETQLDILYQSMSAKLQASQEIPLEWLYEQNRLQLIERYIEDQVNAFSMTANVMTSNLQHTGAQLGTQAGMALLNSTLPAGVNFTFGMPSSLAIYSMVGATQAGSPLHDLFAGFGAEAAQGAKTALITGVTLGYNPRQIAPLVQDALDISRARALTIARSEMIRSYRSANLETFRANDDVCTGWTWMCALLKSSCSACVAMHGTHHSLEESLDDHPNGSCVMVPDTKPWADILGPLGIDTSGIPDTSPDIESGSDWFSRQSEETQRAILGNAKYEAYADGKFQLSDLVGTSHSEDWGSSIYERSLKDTLEEAGKAPAPRELTPEERLQSLADAMSEKYPHCVFDFAGADPVAMETAMQQLDTLFSRYPEAAKIVPYVGTGTAIPENYQQLGFSKSLIGKDSFACSVGMQRGPTSLLFLNQKFFSDVEKFSKKVDSLAKVRWFAKGAQDNGIEYIMTHEFGHVLNTYIDRVLQGDASQTLSDFMKNNKALGDKVSKYGQQYAQTGNLREQFAEAFASLEFAPVGKQAEYTKMLGALLDQLL